MKQQWERRLARLEGAIGSHDPNVVLRYEWLYALPESYVGERHVVVMNRQLCGPGLEWWELEERPGQGPSLDETLDLEPSLS
jgi:hypothetical protein